VLASEKFHGRAFFSVVMISNPGDKEWFAVVHILFRYGDRDLCLLQWLAKENGEDDDGGEEDADEAETEDATGMRRYILLDHCQVTGVDCIKGSVPAVYVERENIYHIDHRLSRYRDRV